MKYMLMLLIILSSSITLAGAISGGGAKGVVCRDKQNQIISAQTLDLFEARAVYGLNLMAQTGSTDEIIQTIKLKLNSSLDQPEIHLFPIINNVQKNFRLTPSDIILTNIDDAALIAAPTGCSIEQLANYVDDNLLLVNQELWNKLNSTEQAALIFHEAIYRLDRFGGATNSRRTRKIVAHLFSDFSFEHVRNGIPKNAKICSASNDQSDYFQFAIYPASKNGLQIQFIWWEGKPVYSKKTAYLPTKLPLDTHNCQGRLTNCLIVGAQTSSNFESNENIALGVQTRVTDGLATRQFDLTTDSGSYQIKGDCGL